ncbi:hypothetical protein C1924_00530 [Stenotrophomonas sp. ESTM1D_MKCIP4_1]|uniref:hypothetical protein n=1 Tax=Stenotrophomonas sp. ESTM1D_MKCIP4_1 TaxID=2072414 RepID=UPI000D5408AB|nr:hypothetical protein [Stenotrophomonas sp. ESTM1D_MKCIP4_1]AWH51782.1 hypothetical protein C1924_00530 [Stenotrophomonas sp. ESTM1D_MKCIP4_1]
MMLAVTAHAQQSAPLAEPAPTAAPPVVEPAAPSPLAAPPQDDVTTLGEVRAIKPEDDEPVDLYRFKNPVKFGDNRFSRDWSEPPSPEQVSMGGGYIMMGVVKGVLAAGRGLNKLTGGPDQIQSAIARPPPELTAEQQRRAQQFCEQQDGCDSPVGR